jgi:Family of unknown function (DUF5946)
VPEEIRCFGCCALVADIEGPVHRYMLSAPGCWQLYGRPISLQYPRTQFSVDGYAVQHPGRPGPQANQSVCVHLMNLGRVLERGGEKARSARFLQQMTHRDYPWLPPPPADHNVTIVDLLGEADPAAFAAMETAYAETAWAAWSSHHGTVRRLIDMLCRFLLSADGGGSPPEVSSPEQRRQPGVVSC